jgi:hypothetical protein
MPHIFSSSEINTKKPAPSHARENAGFSKILDLIFDPKRSTDKLLIQSDPQWGSVTFLNTLIYYTRKKPFVNPLSSSKEFFV